MIKESPNFMGGSSLQYITKIRSLSLVTIDIVIVDLGSSHSGSKDIMSLVRHIV